jgi:uncharacterized protein (TIGR03086 family)
VGAKTAGELESQIAERHLRICELFGEEVTAAAGHWHSPSPCTDWDGRGVLEHVIGFHDVLLLRPLDAKPERPRDDPDRRWTLTRDALGSLFSRPGIFDGFVEVPAIGNNAPSQIDVAPLLKLLSLDVLVHTWDLARTTGRSGHLDPELCSFFLGQLPEDTDSHASTGMYDSPIPVAPDADPQKVLLARLGRDPAWEPPHPNE